MFNPNDLDYIMSADDIRAEEERDAELEAQYRDAVARYEDTYVETEHCTTECSEYGAVSHSAACREAFADSVREFNAIRAAERGEAPAAVDNTRAQREVFEPGLGWVRVPNAPERNTHVHPVFAAILKEVA